MSALVVSEVQSQSIAASLQPDLLGRFIAYLDSSQKTVETYSRALKQLFMYFSVNGISNPQRADIIAFRDDLKASGHKPSTIQNYITAARLFFQWAEQERLYPNIADHVKGAKLDRAHKKDYLTSRQVKDVLSTVDRSSLKGCRDYAILALMVTGGLRTIEVVRADIGDLRTMGDGSVLYVQGKGREEKTEYVKISAPVEKAIRAYLAKRGSVSENDPLFASTSNNNAKGRMTTRAVSALVKDHLIDAGYRSDRLTAHSLRHTAVTLALLAGRELAEVQQFARHANIATTMIYNHALDKAKNGCGEAVSNAVFQ
jgi:integrase/recombinase XerC